MEMWQVMARFEATETMYGGAAPWIMGVFAFIFGACIGSFLNVVIYRIPLGKSVVHPGSHCAACGAPIEWYNNLPILSWWLLRGRAACCGTRIDGRYWVVELMTALLFSGLYWRYGDDWGMFLSYALFVGILIAASGIDIDHYQIPEIFTHGGIVAGVVCSALVPELQGQMDWWDGLSASLAGAFFSGLGLWLVAELGSKVFRKEAMGLGDVFLIAAMGAFLGWKAAIFIVVASSFVGSFYGIFMVIYQRGNWGSRMPYGPFLAAGALLWIFGGDVLTNAYVDEVQRALSETPVYQM